MNSLFTAPDTSAPSRIRRRRRSDRRRRGFLLIEVTLAVGLIVGVAAGIFLLVHSTLTLTAELREQRLRGREVDGTVELLRGLLRTLPTDVLITGLADSPELGPRLVFQPVPDDLILAHYPGPLREAAFALRERAGGLKDLYLLLSYAETPDSLQPPLEDWIPLLPRVAGVEWRFFDPRTQMWMDEWRTQEVRPILIELRLTLAGEPMPRRFVFEVPQ